MEDRSVIEKLGLPDVESAEWVMSGSAFKLRLASVEMLTALIDDLIKTEDEGWCEVCENHEHSDNCKKVLAVQKATCKTWEEIKELIK